MSAYHAKIYVGTGTYILCLETEACVSTVCLVFQNAETSVYVSNKDNYKIPRGIHYSWDVMIM